MERKIALLMAVETQEGGEKKSAGGQKKHQLDEWDTLSTVRSGPLWWVEVKECSFLCIFLDRPPLLEKIPYLVMLSER